MLFGSSRCKVPDLYEQICANETIISIDQSVIIESGDAWHRVMVEYTNPNDPDRKKGLMQSLRKVPFFSGSVFQPVLATHALPARETRSNESGTGRFEHLV